jgi:hypothetical protein
MKKFYVLVSFLFIISLAQAQTNVSGGIYINTTWTLANSPYIVVDTVVVFPGVTLTIEPGVAVKFEDGKRLEIRQAALVANGTATDSITFTSNSLTPTVGIWDKIWFNGGTMNNSQFNYCNFRYGYRAIYITGPALTQLNLKNCLFERDSIAVSCFGFVVKLDSCTFKYNTYYGFVGYNGSVLNHCNFENNYDAVIGMSDSVKNCVFKYNHEGLTTQYCIIENCIINYNQKGTRTSNSIYRNCIINSNSVTGAEMSYYDSLYNCEIKFNGIGIEAGGYMPVIKNNIIDSNSVGIKQSVATASIYCNRICNNTTWDLQYVVAFGGNADVSNNYWCTSDSLSTTARIYDGYDNVNYGLADFMPIDTSNCYLTGCLLSVTAAVVNATCDTCHNGSATANISNGFPPYSYTWYTSPLQYSQTATNLSPGTYTVCVTDGHGCTACNYNVYVDSTNCTGFAITTAVTNATCASCSDGMATANAVAGNPPYAYTWYTVPIQTTQTATGLSAGNYAVCINDLYGCAACDTVTIGIGSCASYYTIYADTIPHTYNLVNMASGTSPLTYDWNWGDGSPHDNTPYPSHTYAASGNYTICLSIIDSSGCSDSYCHSFYLLSPSSSTPVTVNVIPVTTGVQAYSIENPFSLFPNPSSGEITLQLSKFTAEAEVKIFNLLGEKVYEQKIRSQKTEINNRFSPGLYFMRVSDGEKIWVKKVIVE